MDCGRVLKVRWNDVRDQIRSVNPLLATGIDEVATELSEKDLYVARYGYGRLMVDKGHFSSPCGDRSCGSCQDLRKHVSYSCIPFAVLLEKCVEVFVDHGAGPNDEGQVGTEDLRLVPLRLLAEGEMFGVFELLDSILDTRSMPPPWSISAGARSIWIVAPMGDERIHNWIRRKTGVRWVERSPHWKLVEALDGCKWQVGVLIFPDWIVKAVASSMSLRRLLLETGWRQSSNLRHSSLNDAALQKDFLKQNIKAPLGELYQYATIRHLLDIATGVAPAFQPATQARIMAGPFVDVEVILHGVLKGISRDYHPVVLQPGHLLEEGDVGYYSFRCPSVPGPRLPKVANYADIPGTVHEVLKYFRKNPDVSLDIDKTTFFARSGEYSIDEHVDYLPMAEFFPSNSAKDKSHRSVYLNSPFFVSGARIVRSGSKDKNAISKVASA
jgi:hypothetical protein